MRNYIYPFINDIRHRDSSIYKHSQRVSTLSCLIGHQLGLSVKELENLKNAALLHDLGKIKIPNEIINKNDSLSVNEFEIIKTHPVIGSRILKRKRKPTAAINNAILEHHERYDGKGYPQGIKGENISFLARIITVADSLDAMISPRPYKNQLSIGEAKREIQDCSGGQFDPYIVYLALSLDLYILTKRPFTHTLITH